MEGIRKRRKLLNALFGVALGALIMFPFFGPGVFGLAMTMAMGYVMGWILRGSNGMEWRGKQIKGGDRGDLIGALSEIDNEQDAREFYRRYRNEFGPDHAAMDIGYVTGDLGHEQGRRIQQWCNVAHPFIGFFSDEPLNPDELIEIGKKTYQAFVRNENAVHPDADQGKALQEFERSLGDGTAWKK